MGNLIKLVSENEILKIDVSFQTEIMTVSNKGCVQFRITMIMLIIRRVFFYRGAEGSSLTPTIAQFVFTLRTYKPILTSYVLKQGDSA